MATAREPDLSLETWGPERTKRFTERLEADRVRKEEKKRKLREPFELEVGRCLCTGPIVFDFKGMQPVGPMSQVRLGGHNEMEESYILSCTSCGTKYERHHPPFVQKIDEYRDKL